MATAIEFIELTGDLVNYFENIDPLVYSGRSDFLIFDNKTSQTEVQVRALVKQFPLKYLKVSGQFIQEKTKTEKDAVDDLILTLTETDIRLQAKTALDNKDINAVVLKALVGVILDHLNDRLSHRHNDLLAWLGTQVGLVNRNELPNFSFSQIDLDQFKSALMSKIENQIL